MKKRIFVLVTALSIQLCIILSSCVDTTHLIPKPSTGVWKCDELSITVYLYDYSGYGIQNINGEERQVQLAWTHTWNGCRIDYSDGDAIDADRDLIFEGSFEWDGGDTLTLTEDEPGTDIYIFTRVTDGDQPNESVVQ